MFWTGLRHNFIASASASSALPARHVKTFLSGIFVASASESKSSHNSQAAKLLCRVSSQPLPHVSMSLSLGDLSSAKGVEQLEKHLADRTYVSG